MLVSIILALLPFLVNGLTQLVKWIPALSTMSDGWHKALLRFVAALLSFVGVVATAWSQGVPVDLTSVQLFVDAFLAFVVFMASQGTFFMFRPKQILSGS